MNSRQMVVDFQENGAQFVDAEGKRVVEMLSYSCAPARIDGLEDAQTVAIRVEGEDEDYLTPYDPALLRRV